MLPKKNISFCESVAKPSTEKKQVVEVLLIEFGNGSSIFSHKPRYRVSCFLLMDASGNKFYFTVASCCRYDIIV